MKILELTKWLIFLGVFLFLSPLQSDADVFQVGNDEYIKVINTQIYDDSQLYGWNYANLTEEQKKQIVPNKDKYVWVSFQRCSLSNRHDCESTIGGAIKDRLKAEHTGKLWSSIIGYTYYAASVFTQLGGLLTKSYAMAIAVKGSTASSLAVHYLEPRRQGRLAEALRDDVIDGKTIEVKDIEKFIADLHEIILDL